MHIYVRTYSYRDIHKVRWLASGRADLSVTVAHVSDQHTSASTGTASAPVNYTLAQ